MRKLLVLPLSLGFVFLTQNNAEAFLWGLTQEEESICRNRASKKQNSFSAKKAYDFCKKNIKKEKNNIKKEKNKEKKYKYCMSNYQDEIEQARYEYNLKLIKLRKEAKNNPPNPPKNCDEIPNTHPYIDERGLCKSRNERNRLNNARLKRLKEAELRSDLDGFTSKCRKKAGYK